MSACAMRMPFLIVPLSFLSSSTLGPPKTNQRIDPHRKDKNGGIQVGRPDAKSVEKDRNSRFLDQNHGIPVRMKVTDSCEGLVASQDKNGVKKGLNFRPHNGHT